MSHIENKVKNLLLEFLSPDFGKSATHLVEEIRVEYPEFFNELIVYYQEEYNLSGCGALMSPITVVNQTLASLHDDGLIDKYLKNNASLWKMLTSR